MKRFYIFTLSILLSIFLLQYEARSETESLDAVSGTGTGNAFTAEGATVGDDCATQGDNQESSANTINANLVVPLEDSTESGSIAKVTVSVRVRANQASANVRLLVVSGASTYLGDNQSLGGAGTYQTITQDWTTNPDTSNAWTWAEIDALETGLQTKSNATTYEVDYVKVDVTYFAANSDSDGDGIPDYDEYINGLDKDNPNDAQDDADGDTLSNLLEYQIGTNINNPDTDGDGLNDGTEYYNSILSPTDSSDVYQIDDRSGGVGCGTIKETNSGNFNFIFLLLPILIIYFCKNKFIFKQKKTHIQRCGFF